MKAFQKGLILCLALCAFAILQQAPAQGATPSSIQPEAWQIVALANQARAEVGAGPLKWDQGLAMAARQHCLRMAAEGPISHRYAGEPDLTERAGQAGAHFSLIEENVAIGPTPAEIHNEWMHSSGHRANLLNPDVDRVGIAVVASRGVLYAVADYERDVPTLTQAQVETAIAGLLRGSGIALMNNPADARASCVQDHAVRSSRQPGFFMLWQGTDVAQLPKQLEDRIASGQYREAAVGSCPAQTDGNSFTSYRVAVLLY
jgi:hypothetical protein